MAVKKRTAIELTEITAMPHLKTASGYLIGTFMTAFSVHHNRVPLSGTVVFKHETRSRNNQTTARLMTNILLNRAPLEQNSTHIIENDRITTGIQSRAGVYSITQIADKWISHIINQVEPGGYLNRGERFGMIRFGSQVDVFIPDELGYTPVVQPGDYVYAGTTILASQTSDAAPNSLIINRHNTE